MVAAGVMFFIVGLLYLLGILGMIFSRSVGESVFSTPPAKSSNTAEVA
jgi:hypothetical protein